MGHDVKRHDSCKKNSLKTYLGDHPSHPAIDRPGLGTGKGDDDNHHEHHGIYEHGDHEHYHS